MIDMNKTYKTRDGRPVRILCTDGPDQERPVIGVIDGNVHVTSWSKDGRHPNNDLDLIEVKPKRVFERWVDIYPDYEVYHFTKEEADNAACSGRIVCLHIRQEYMEGEGL